MKLLELRSPTTLTPQTPLPLTPSAAGVKRQFVVPTTKPAPPLPTNDIAKDTTTTTATASDEGVVKDNTMLTGMADNTGDKSVVANGNKSSQNITSQLQEDNMDVLTEAESGGGAELLPPVNEEMTNNTTNENDLFPIDFPNTDNQSPINEDHMIPEGNEGIQQSIEFESSNQIPSDIASPDPTAFGDFDPVSQFDQSNTLPETDQSDQLEKLAEQLDQLPQQPVPIDDNRQTDGIDVQQLELPNDNS